MIGIDCIDIERVDKSDEFLQKIARDNEIEYIKKSFCESLRLQRTGALFCVKEAVMKEKTVVWSLKISSFVTKIVVNLM